VERNPRKLAWWPLPAAEQEANPPAADRTKLRLGATLAVNRPFSLPESSQDARRDLLWWAAAACQRLCWRFPARHQLLGAVSATEV